MLFADSNMTLTAFLALLRSELIDPVASMRTNVFTMLSSGVNGLTSYKNFRISGIEALSFFNKWSLIVHDYSCCFFI